MSPSVSARLLLTQSDARLVAFARAGHERAFEALVRRYRGPLLGYCRRLLLSDERAEDALQQALTQAWLALRADTEVQNAKAWLYRIVHNSALNALRGSGYDYCTLSESLSGAGAPQEDLDRRIAVREALAGLAALPEMQREALLRTAVEGSSHREAARELGVSEPALRGLVYRARTTLRATAGAFMPAPVVSWALSNGSSVPAGERAAEVGVAGGAGVAGLLMKGGAMAVTAGVLAGSIATVHLHRVPVSGRGSPAGVHRRTRGGTRQLALASVSSSSRSWRPSARVMRLSASPSAPAPTRRSTHEPSVARVRGREHYEPSPAVSTPTRTPVAMGPTSSGSERGNPGVGGGEAHEGQPGTDPGSAGGADHGGSGGAARGRGRGGDVGGAGEGGRAHGHAGDRDRGPRGRGSEEGEGRASSAGATGRQRDGGPGDARGGGREHQRERPAAAAGGAGESGGGDGASAMPSPGQAAGTTTRGGVGSPAVEGGKVALGGIGGTGRG